MPKVDIKKNIYVENARVHNLKNLSVAIPRNKLVVVTGVSGSGKTSLAFDTLYAEGQRQYVESLSSYARQFLGRVEKPAVDYIKGIAPAIAIQQKVTSKNPRSTVGTTTEIYDFLRLLFARVGKTYRGDEEVKKETVEDVIHWVQSTGGKKYRGMILCALQIPEGRDLTEHLQVLLQQGFVRVMLGGKIEKIQQLLDDGFKSGKNDLLLVIDRFSSLNDEEEIDRFKDSLQLGFFEGKGKVVIELEGDQKEIREFSNKFELDGEEFIEPVPNFFSFNNPLGACPVCEGYGKVIGIDEDLVIPNKNLSVYEGAIACWSGDKMGKWLDDLTMSAYRFDFPIHQPYVELSDEQKQLLWTGNSHFKGLNAFFKYIEEKSYKIQYRVMLSRYRGKTTCHECGGKRLRKETNNVKVGGKSLMDLVDVPVSKLKHFFAGLELDKYAVKVAERLLKEINNRIDYLMDVGLGYLTLNRLSGSLSGGESQRINLATMLGSNLVGSMYILDEPSIGLHSRDTHNLIRVLRKLQSLGNTVIVVEHDEDIMREADEILDIGPEAGTGGGNLVAKGSLEQLMKKGKGYTAKYLSGEYEIPVPERRRKWSKSILIEGARENNLKNIDVEFPLNVLTVVTGVSGSGKSTLMRKILFPALNQHLHSFGDKPGLHKALKGDLNAVSRIEFVDQNPIGRSSRSSPVTYSKAWDDIRQLFSQLPLSKMNAYKPSIFSLNVAGGRCEHCQGEGEITVEMQFMADVKLKCENCNGKKFKEEVLEVRLEGKSIFDILELTIDEAIEFFDALHQKSKEHFPKKKAHVEGKIREKLIPLQKVGLGYVKLGQSSSTLSGGEAQRVKLASFLNKGEVKEPTLFIFDEPTTGLHFHDIGKLLTCFDALIEKGHTVISIEHNEEVVKCADWVIDLGPEGGDEGGQLMFSGTPEDLIKCEESYTAKSLESKINYELT